MAHLIGGFTALTTRKSGSGATFPAANDLEETAAY
jgi:hypothetical protein